MFRENNHQQLSLIDSFTGLTAREQKALEKSWAKVFADDIFPAIDEKRFSVLYSDAKASRPNTPVNVIIGALIIKEMFDYSDDEMVDNLMLDLHLQYALHTTSFQEQPLSDKTLSRFRMRCYSYEALHGVDLYRDCVKDLGSKIAKIMKINGRVRRMDSMMMESNIRSLGRLELLYTCISKLVIYLSKAKPTMEVPSELIPYADSNDFNRVFHYQRSAETDKVAEKLLSDSELLLFICKDDYENVVEYKNFMRYLSEQTIVEQGIRRFRTKEERVMNSSFLQNPSDPEATYRVKAGKSYHGYVANLEESAGKNGSVVTDYQYEQNTYSDSQFLQDSMNNLETTEPRENQDEEDILVTDGSYGGGENVLLCAQKNVKLITTALIGTEVKDIFADFVFNEDGTRLLSCAAGYSPRSCNYTKSTGQCRISFNREECANCQYRNQCKPKIGKTVATFTTSKNAHDRAKHQRYMKSDDFKDYARFRNGIETVPSNLRNNYHLKKLPRGRQRGKFFFGSKVGALNFRKLFNYRKDRGNYALNPVLN